MRLSLPPRTNSPLKFSQGFLRSMHDVLSSTAANKVRRSGGRRGAKERRFLIDLHVASASPV